MKIRNAVMLALLTVGMGVAQASLPLAWGQTSDAQSAIAKSIGTIKTINGSSLTLSPSSGPEVAVTVESSARILRLAPGDRDLKNAAPIQLQDLKVGDTVRARGHATAGGIDALEIVVITSSAMDAVKEQVRQDWQKRGIGGIVDSVDAAGNVTLSIPGLGEKRTLVVHTTKNTVVYRYSPDSAKPEDAKQVALQDIHVGDQLRARGNHGADRSEITAEEIYTGVFPQFDATIKSINTSSGTLSVQDLKTKKTVELKITKNSQLHQIPAEQAQRFAAFLKLAKSGALPGVAGNSSASGSAVPTSPANAAGSTGGMGHGATAGGMGGGGRFGGGGGGMDFQRRLDQTPAVTLADLHKGDAISVLTTEGTPAGGSTVIKMFSGVEPILEAAPNAMMLSPWTLGGAPGGDAAQ